LCSSLIFWEQSGKNRAEQNLENRSYNNSAFNNFTVSEHTTDIDIIEVDEISVSEKLELTSFQDETDVLNITLFHYYETDSINI